MDLRLARLRRQRRCASASRAPILTLIQAKTRTQTADSRPTLPSAPLARITWERRLTLRQKLARGGAITLLVSLTLYLLLGGPANTVATLGRVGGAIYARLHPPKPQPTLAERGYTSIKSPPGAYNLPEISIAPAIGQANAAWACWSSPFAQNAPRGAWTAMAYYTANSGVKWNPLALPEPAAQDCSISADSERSASALFILSQGLAADGSCIAPLLYLTSDTGATWAHVPWPTGSAAGACQFHTALQGGVIYIWSITPVIRGTDPYAPPTGRLVVSRDAGQTWSPADSGLDDSTGFDIIGLRPGGHILADITNTHGSGYSTTLMTSDDFGATWRSLGGLPGAFPQVFVSSNGSVTDHGGWGRLYELARTVVNGSPSVPPQLYLATAYIGQGWTSIPLPPLVSGTTTNAQSSQPLVIGIGPAGVLEVERGIVETTNAQLSPARRFWVWNPLQSEWLLDPQAVPGNLELQGASWSAGNQIFWMTTLQLGVPPVLQIYTKTYPANLLGQIEWSGATGT